MSRVAIVALLSLGALAGCVPGPGDPYGFGYSAAPAPYYGGGYAPYYAPVAEPTVIIGGERDYGYRGEGYRGGEGYRDRGYRDRGYREQGGRDRGYREQGSREQRPREERGGSPPRIVGNRIENPQAGVPAQARPSPPPRENRIEGNTIHIN